MNTAETVAKALRRAFGLGERHWQQADSEYTSQHRKADETYAKFERLVSETVAAVVAGQPATAQQGAVPPTPEMLSEMAYKLRLVPPGDVVPIQVLDVLREQYISAVSVIPTTRPGSADALAASLTDRADWNTDPLEVVKAIELGLLRGYAAADLLDENSPIRDAVRALAAAPNPPAPERSAMSWGEAHKLVEAGMARYKERHPKWWKRMDGTPILNDLPCVLAEVISEATENPLAHDQPPRAEGYDGSYVENHCGECGEYESECQCDGRSARVEPSNAEIDAIEFPGNHPSGLRRYAREILRRFGGRGGEAS